MGGHALQFITMIEPPIHRLPTPSLLIGSQHITDATGGAHDHIYAATGRATLTVPLAGLREIDAAAHEAGEALRHWRELPSAKRGRILHSVGEALALHRDDLAAIQTIETGMPIAFSSAATESAANYFFYNSGWADKISGDVVSPDATTFDYTMEHPYGVIGAIIPWNASVVAASQVLAPILAAGNTVVLKPSELAPYSSLRLAELALDAGLPAGVVNVVTGGASAGAALVRHPRISKIHFTGSRDTARDVLAAAAENIVPVCLELGGKSPLLVFADADLMAAAEQSMSAMAGLSGQGCALPTRVLVQQEIYDRFLTILKGLLRRLVVGDPLDGATHIGPLISDSACDRVMAVINRAKARTSGKVIAGGTRLKDKFADGYFVAPTIFADVAAESDLAQEEIFGPVLSVMSFADDADAIRMANDNPYGLAAYVFTEDLRRAHRVSAALDAGTVWINGMDGLDPAMPFGGWKQSGYGRLGGSAGIREFTRSKNISMLLGTGRRIK